MNKEYRKHGLLLLGVILLICGIGFLPFHNQGKEEEILQRKKTSMHVYLLHEDMLVQYPTISEATKSADKIKEIVHYLTQSAGPFKALLKEGSQLQAVDIKKGIATLSFTSLKYEKENERHLVESLIFGCTQFNDVSEIQIQVQEKTMSNLPLNNTPLLNLNRSFGINHVDSNQLYLHKGNEKVLYFKRSIDGKGYAIPRSTRLLHKDDYNEVLNTILCVPSAASNLEQPLANKNIGMEKEARFEDGVLHLYLNRNILSSNKKLDEECEQYLKLNFREFDAIYALKIHVDTKTYDIIVKK